MLSEPWSAEQVRPWSSRTSTHLPCEGAHSYHPDVTLEVSTEPASEYSCPCVVPSPWTWLAPWLSFTHNRMWLSLNKSWDSWGLWGAVWKKPSEGERQCREDTRHVERGKPETTWRRGSTAVPASHRGTTSWTHPHRWPLGRPAEELHGWAQPICDIMTKWNARCFNPPRFGVVCYTAIDNWKRNVF